MFGLKNKRHPNVGRKFYSPYFNREMVITAYNRDTNWYFIFADKGDYEFKGQVEFSYMVNQGLERKETFFDKGI